MKTLTSIVLAVLALVAGVVSGAQPTDSSPHLKTATTVSTKYHVALPKNWNPDRQWPIVVTIDGSGHNFEANIHAFVKARGDRPFIIVTPHVSSNGRDPED